MPPVPVRIPANGCRTGVPVPRHLIELGGLVQKAGLVELVDDDRATLLGAFLMLADQLRDGADGVSSNDLRTRWRRRGLRAFDADHQATVAPDPPHQPGQPNEGTATA